MNTTNALSAVVPTSRRSFLQKAATLAAAGATSSVTTAIALPTQADAAPMAEPDRFIAAAFCEIGDEIDETYDAWCSCNEECTKRDRAVNAWEARNPPPVYIGYGEEGYSATARSDWQERRFAIMRRLELGSLKQRHNELGDAYNDAIQRFAALNATTPSELFYKAGYGAVFDDRNSLIAKSVLADLFNFRTRLFAVSA